MTEEPKKEHKKGARIVELKIKNSRCDSAFRTAKNKLINATDDEESSEGLFTELTDKLETVMEECTQNIEI